LCSGLWSRERDSLLEKIESRYSLFKSREKNKQEESEIERENPIKNIEIERTEDCTFGENQSFYRIVIELKDGPRFLVVSCEQGFYIQ
jgi:hypothetical protein